MRACLVVVCCVAACSSSTPHVSNEPRPALAPASTPVEREDGEHAIRVVADRGCIPAATYDVLVDTSTADVVTTAATPRDRCVELANQIPARQTLTIDYPDDEPRVDWRGAQRTVVVDACAIHILGAADTVLSFRNQHGRGTLDLDLGEGCAARGARIELTRHGVER